MARINLTSFFIPVIVAIIILAGMRKRVNVFDEFLLGAQENIKVGVSILPAILGLMVSINMLKASGAMLFVSNLISPVTDFLGFPSECVPLAMIRPVSGSGALTVYEGIIKDNGPDSFVGKVASVLLGSTETTFYTIAVYYGVTKIKKTKQTLAAALSADFTGFVFSSLIVRLML